MADVPRRATPNDTSSTSTLVKVRKLNADLKINQYSPTLLIPRLARATSRAASSICQLLLLLAGVDWKGEERKTTDDRRWKDDARRNTRFIIDNIDSVQSSWTFNRPIYKSSKGSLAKLKNLSSPLKPDFVPRRWTYTVVNFLRNGHLVSKLAIDFFPARCIYPSFIAFGGKYTRWKPYGTPFFRFCPLLGRVTGTNGRRGCTAGL